MFPGAEDNVIVCEVLCATNVYHTSYLSEAPHPGFGSVDGFHVAFTFVPAVFAQDVEDDNVMAPEHSSLAGWAIELNEDIRPNNRNITVAKGYRKRFISSKGALVFQDLDNEQNKWNYLLITRAFVL